MNNQNLSHLLTQNKYNRIYLEIMKYILANLPKLKPQPLQKPVLARLTIKDCRHFLYLQTIVIEISNRPSKLNKMKSINLMGKYLIK